MSSPSLTTLLSEGEIHESTYSLNVSFNPTLFRFAVRDMRQTVAVGVIKATTPKVVEGSKTKAAQKADKKK